MVIVSNPSNGLVQVNDNRLASLVIMTLVGGSGGTGDKCIH